MDAMTTDENRTLQDKFMLRLPDGMRDRIRVAAEANNRSMNSEIVAALDEKYPEPKSEIDRDDLDRWAREVREIEDEGEKRKRLAEVNRTLSEHPDWSGWVLQLGEMIFEDGRIVKGVYFWPPGAR